MRSDNESGTIAGTSPDLYNTHTHIRMRIAMNANLIDEDTPRTIVVSTTITIIIYRYNKCKTMKNSCFLTLRRYPRRVFIFPCVSACTAGRHIGKHEDKGTCHTHTDTHACTPFATRRLSYCYFVHARTLRGAKDSITVTWSINRKTVGKVLRRGKGCRVNGFNRFDYPMSELTSAKQRPRSAGKQRCRYFRSTYIRI